MRYLTLTREEAIELHGVIVGCETYREGVNEALDALVSRLEAFIAGTVTLDMGDGSCGELYSVRV